MTHINISGGRLCRAATLPLLIASLAGCSGQPTQAVSTWHDSGASGRPYGKILVVAVTEDSNQRRRFENALAAVFTGGGIEAWASNSKMTFDQPVNRETIGAVVDETGADAVTVTRLVSHEVVGEEVDARSGVRTTPETEATYDIYTYRYQEYATGAYIVAKSTVTLTTDVFEATEGEHIYTVQTTTYDKESEFEIVNEATRAISARLREDRVIR